MGCVSCFSLAERKYKALVHIIEHRGMIWKAPVGANEFNTVRENCRSSTEVKQSIHLHLIASIHVYPFLYWFVAWINVICLTWLGWNFCHSLLVAVNRILLEFGNWTQTYFFFFDKFYLIGRQKLRKLRCFVKTFDKGGALCLLRLLPSSLCCQPLPGGWARQFQKTHSLLLSTR